MNYIWNAHGKFSFCVNLKIGFFFASLKIEHVHFARVTSRGYVLSIWWERHSPCISFGIFFYDLNSWIIILEFLEIKRLPGEASIVLICLPDSMSHILIIASNELDATSKTKSQKNIS